MGLQGYVGNAHDVARIRKQEKQREEERKRFEELKKQSDANVDKAGLRQFGTAQSEVLENAFKAETIGLVTREEFVEKRKTLADRLEEEATKRKREAEEAARAEKERRKRAKAKLAQKSKLSFLGGEDDEEGQEEEEKEQDNGKPAAVQLVAATDATDAQHNESSHKQVKLGKDPTIATHFLPDKDREEQEAQLRAQLKAEYEAQQAAIQAEPLAITYSYWNGSGHRREVVIRKGDSVGVFLAHVKEQLNKDFREVRAMSVSNMMYVKEDLILPHSVTFYSLIKNKARGKSGPLFHFDVHDDVRLQGDARIEKDESHAGKVVDRHWYDKNKHIFPANRWEVYDPDDPQKYSSYTVHDRLQGK